MRTAIVHYWLLNMRGGEKDVEALCRLLPDADIFTLFYDPDCVSETIRRHRVQASFLQPLRRGYRSLLPLMAWVAAKNREKVRGRIALRFKLIERAACGDPEKRSIEAIEPEPTKA